MLKSIIQCFSDGFLKKKIENKLILVLVILYRNILIYFNHTIANFLKRRRLYKRNKKFALMKSLYYKRESFS